MKCGQSRAAGHAKRATAPTSESLDVTNTCVDKQAHKSRAREGSHVQASVQTRRGGYPTHLVDNDAAQG